MSWTFQPLLTGSPLLLGSTGSEVVAEQGTFTLSGQSVSFGRSVVFTQGSYALSGQDATLTYTPYEATGRTLISSRSVISARDVIGATRSVVTSRTVI